MDDCKNWERHFDDNFCVFKGLTYDELIPKLVPKYDEMHKEVVGLIDFPREKPIRILDLGVGSGRTTKELLRKYPYSRVDAIDISDKMIKMTSSKLADYIKGKRLSVIKQDMRTIELDNKYDAVVGVLSVHHLQEGDRRANNEKFALFKKLYDILKPGGVLVIGDIVKFLNKKFTLKKEAEWKEFLVWNFTDQADVDFWFDENYKKTDFPSALGRQLGWLKDAGFEKAQEVWRCMNYSVFYGKKGL